MPRRRKKSTKRSRTLGIALEVATLAAIILLARPDWIAKGFQIAQQYRDGGQILTPEDSEQNTRASQIIADPPVSDQTTTLPSAVATLKRPDRPAEVIPAGEWLPGYFDVVGSHVPKRPAVYLSPHFAGQQPNTAILPWPILPQRNF